MRKATKPPHIAQGAAQGRDSDVKNLPMQRAKEKGLNMFSSGQNRLFQCLGRKLLTLCYERKQCITSKKKSDSLLTIIVAKIYNSLHSLTVSVKSADKSFAEIVENS